MSHSTPEPFFSSPDNAVSRSSVAGPEASDALILPHNLVLPEIHWPRRGSLSFMMQLEGLESSRELELQRGEYLGVKFIQNPLFDLQLFFSRQGTGGFGWLFETDKGEQQRFNAPFTHLRGGQPYLIHLNWDMDEMVTEVYFNGISQGDISHGSNRLPLADRPQVATRLEGRFSQGSLVGLRLGQFQLLNEMQTPEEIAQHPALANIPRLVDEGRVTYDHPLDLRDYQLEQIYSANFSEPFLLLREQDLFSEGQRVRTPEDEDEWILEGPDEMMIEIRSDGLYMENSSAEDLKDGHWVLWLNRIFPDNYLVKYSFTPRDDAQGLNILFFSAHYPDGKTIFDLDLPYRGGDFRPYIVGELNSYHISPWATDGENIRATSNMRKNSGFTLVARGNDVIGGSGDAPHTVRILKVGKKIRMEANGVQCLAFDDDENTYGPVYEGGYIGIRFMGHTGYATLHDVRVFSITPKP